MKTHVADGEWRAISFVKRYSFGIVPWLLMLTALPNALGQTNCAPAPAGLVSWWPAEGNANDFVDANSGTLLNGAGFAAGEVGQAFNFATNAHVRIADRPNLHLTNSLTIEAWIRPNSIGGYQSIVCKWDVAFFYQKSYCTAIHADGRAYLDVCANGDESIGPHMAVFSTNTIVPNVWTHFAGTYDGTFLKIYLNGVMENQVLYTNRIFPGTNDLGIGGYVGGGAVGVVGSTFQGQIDEPSIYSRALSASEILAIYNAGSFGKCQPTGAPPVIVTQPQSQVVTVGGAVNFIVNAVGTPPLSYQWRFGTNNILGATSSSLILSNVQPSQAGPYSVRVANAFGAVISSNAFLTVNPGITGCVASASGLVSWWPGEGNANDIVDANSGIPSNLAFSGGKVGQSFFFNGSNAFVTIPASSSLNLGQGNGLTLEGWLAPGDLSRAQIVAEWNDGAGHVGVQLQVSVPELGGLGSVFANLVDSAGTDHFIASDPGLLQIGTFQHVALIYNKGNGVARLFYNGQLIKTQVVGVFVPQTTYSFYLGRRISGPGTGEFYKGNLDEFSLYNRALSDAEVLSVYNAGSFGKCQPTGVPAIVTQPQSQLVTIGGTATFSVTAVGTPPLSYQWRFGTNNILGATSSSLILSNVQPSQAGPYSVRVANDFGSVISSNAFLTTITGCLASASGLVSWWPGEGNANDIIDANSGIPSNLAFSGGKVGQSFFFNGSNAFVTIPASSSLNVGPSNGFTLEGWLAPGDLSRGQIVAEWNDGAGHVGVQLQVSVPELGGLGSVFANLVDSGGADHFIASDPGLLQMGTLQHVALIYNKATGVARLYYNGQLIRSQTVGVFVPQTTYSFYLGRRISGPGTGEFYKGNLDEFSLYNRALSDAEVLSVYNAGSFGKCQPTGVPPAIVTQPQSQLVTVGGTANFSVNASGTPPLSYQWRFGTNNILGATSSSLILSNVQPSQAGPYSVRVANDFGSVISSNAFLTTITGCLASASGLVSWWPGEGNANDIVDANSGIPSNLAFSGGKVGQSFFFNGSNAFVTIPASSSLNVGPSNGFTLEGWLAPGDLSRAQIVAEWNDGAGHVGVQLQVSVPELGGLGSVFANLVDSAGADHFIASDPGLLQIGTFQHVALIYNKANGVARLYYNGQLIRSQTVGVFVPQTTYGFYLGRRISGPGTGEFYKGNLDEFSLYNRALSDAEVLSVYNAGSFGKCQPTAVPPAIVTQPQSQIVTVGGTANFSVNASGTPPLSYQWRFGTNNILGATSSSLILSNVQPSQAGPYSVQVANDFGAVLSSNALLTVRSFSTGCVANVSGLVAWWPAEGNAQDIVGGNSGTLSNVTFAPGQVGQAFVFNGSNAAVSIPASPGLNVGTGNGLTIECWVKPGELNVARPLVEWNSGTQEGVHLWISEPWWDNQGGPGSLFANIEDTSGFTRALVSPPGVLTTNSFHHVAVTYDKASGMGYLYADGVVVFSAHLGQFTPQTSYDLYLGLRPPNSAYSSIYDGLMDEVSLYGRALGPDEIVAIYLAGMGKCQGPLPPFITSQPISRSVAVGSNVTFSVSAGGTPPLSYQWRFNGTNIDGAISNVLTLINVQPANAGLYSVVVTNTAGVAVSSNAVLTVNTPVALVRVGSISNVPAGGTITVPVLLSANGNENALGFSLNFSPARLTYVSSGLGTGAPNATLFVNQSQVSTGRLGLALALPSGTTFPPGMAAVVQVTFDVALSTNQSTTTIGFGDAPIIRQLADVDGNALPVNYQSGFISIVPVQLEADVSPRPGGNRAVTITDWVLVGRYAAGLDSPTNASEFQRADCAPRNTLGNGLLTATDWVQAGRYAAGLDPLTAAGGPTEPAPSAPVFYRQSASGPQNSPGAREVIVSDARLYNGQSGTVLVRLRAQGDENALGFSLAFDPAMLTYIGAALNNAAGATLNVNASQAAAGRVGILLSLSPGATFAAGIDELVKVNFQPNALGTFPVSFADQPVIREISDPAATGLPADYTIGTVTISPLPTLKISQSAQKVVLSWPSDTDQFVLQQADGPLSGSMKWSNVEETVSITNGEYRVSLSADAASRFYRLYHP